MNDLAVTAATSEDDLHDVARLRWQWRVEAGEVEAASGDEAGYVASLTRWAREHAVTHVPYLARLAGDPVGIGWLGVLERIPSPTSPVRRAGMVQSVYVVPERRGDGIGAGVLAAVIAEARARGLDYLMVHPSERSVSFYRRAGFTTNGDRALELRFEPAVTGGRS